MADPAPGRDIRPNRARRLLVTAVLVVLAFIVGFGWQWWEARQARGEVARLERELRLQTLESTLASAVIQVDNGGYEAAREAMSRFFTGLQESRDDASGEALAAFQDILSRRDAVITALSRSDPGAEEVLTRIFLRYRVATGGPAEGIPIPTPGPAAPGSDTAAPDSMPEASPGPGG